MASCFDGFVTLRRAPGARLRRKTNKRPMAEAPALTRAETAVAEFLTDIARVALTSAGGGRASGCRRLLLPHR